MSFGAILATSCDPICSPADCCQFANIMEWLNEEEEEEEAFKLALER